MQSSAPIGEVLDATCGKRRKPFAEGRVAVSLKNTAPKNANEDFLG
jgi:hypothetical protein